MKETITIILLAVMSMLFCIQSYASTIEVNIKGEEAKTIYLHLTGKSIEQQGAAGHLYKKGKNILCQFINADMSDEKQREISRSDIRRYSCSFKLNENGKIEVS